MIISLRAKSELKNYLQNSSQLRSLRKCTVRVFESHDQEHMINLLSEALYVLVIIFIFFQDSYHMTSNLQKCTYEAERNGDEF
jgi:hypothetical protein